MKCYKALIFFIILVFMLLINMPAHCGGLNPAEAYQTQLRGFKAEIIDPSYVITHDAGTCRELALITNNLNSSKWPILPTSYRLERRDNGKDVPIWCITRHRNAPDVDLTLYAFGADRANGVNYVVQANKRTTYAYAHTRKPAVTKKGGQYTFRDTEGSAYVDGHCIDNGDTALETLNLYGNNSSHHLVNHIPEPEHTAWGLTYRNHLVQDFRKYNQSYSQWVFYPQNPLITTLETAVPLGVLFTNSSLDNASLADGWSVPWDDLIHDGLPAGRSVRMTIRSYGLNILSTAATGEDLITERVKPTSFVYIKDKLDKYFNRALPIPGRLDTPYDRFSLYRMETLADNEILPNWSIYTFECLLDQLEEEDEISERKALYWLQRFITHARSLQVSGFKKVMDEKINLLSIHKKLKDHPTFDADRSFEDELGQILGDLEIEVHDPFFLDDVDGFVEHPDILVTEFPDRSFSFVLSTGKGSENAITKNPIVASHFRDPRTFILRIMDQDTRNITRKVNKFIATNGGTLKGLGKSILRFQVEGILSGKARLNLRILMGDKLEELA